MFFFQKNFAAPCILTNIYIELITFSRVKGEDRQKWVEKIQIHQELDTSHAVYICDVHFRPSDLTKNGNSFRPKKNVLPKLGSDIGADCSQNETEGCITITLVEYRRIVECSIQLYKANDTIKKLETIVQQKENKIRYLKTRLEAEKLKINEDFSQVIISHCNPLMRIC